MPPTRVLLADDHHLLMGALEKLLEGDCQVIGRVSDGRELVTAALELKPDVIVLDVGMPSLNGLEAGRQIKQSLRSVKLVYVTMNEDPDIAAEAFRARRVGLFAQALGALRAADGHSGGHAGPLVRDAAGHRGAGRVTAEREDRKAGPELTSRQREILQLVAEGRSMKEIAGVLDITPRTVAHHKYRMMDQLHIKSTAELVQYAVKHHIV